jgi:hypothetical protein
MCLKKSVVVQLATTQRSRLTKDSKQVTQKHSSIFSCRQKQDTQKPADDGISKVTRMLLCGPIMWFIVTLFSFPLVLMLHLLWADARLTMLCCCVLLELLC